MSYRSTGDPTLDEYLRDLEDRLRRLERGDANSGRVSFSVAKFGGLTVSAGSSEGREVLVVTRISDGQTCVIDPGRCEPEAPTEYEVVFSLPGPLSTQPSERYHPYVSGTLVALHASVATAGTTPSTILVYKNDEEEPITAVTILADLNTGGAAVDGGLFRPDLDYLRVVVSEAGEGAADLTLSARFAEPTGTAGPDGPFTPPPNVSDPWQVGG